MRYFLSGVALLVSLCAAPISAATMAVTTEISHRTTDWTPFVLRNPDDPQNALLAGSQTFEDSIYYDPGTESRFRLPTLDTGLMPFDWVHISHDLTLQVETTGPAGSQGSFHVQLGAGGPLFVSGGYSRADGIWTSGAVRSVGTFALDAADFSLFAPGARANHFFITGGSASFRYLGFPRDQLTQENYPDIRIQELTRHIGTLFGTITVTAGYEGASEPLAAQSFVTISQVPLPAPGLLLGAGLLAISARRRRRRG